MYIFTHLSLSLSLSIYIYISHLRTNKVNTEVLQFPINHAHCNVWQHMATCGKTCAHFEKTELELVRLTGEGFGCEGFDCEGFGEGL